ncbi:unnamed protein product [Fraxinus pennsylvanica]|uniref:Uncharacterized protein n=1 Tax=Fraxinus pennsylvanica TaxID=56036 RepID=A0AAD2AE44_9LAMI|nr:unnamed protein product [Fraxinus pennsylvanica]
MENGIKKKKNLESHLVPQDDITRKLAVHGVRFNRNLPRCSIENYANTWSKITGGVNLNNAMHNIVKGANRNTTIIKVDMISTKSRDNTSTPSFPLIPATVVPTGGVAVLQHYSPQPRIGKTVLDFARAPVLQIPFEEAATEEQEEKLDLLHVPTKAPVISEVVVDSGPRKVIEEPLPA